MEVSYLLLIAVTFGLLFITIQRTEKTKRRIVWLLVIVIGLLIRHNAFLQNDLHEETFFGFLGGLLIAGIFWGLIGRYNPVGTSDEIKVIGLDD